MIIVIPDERPMSWNKLYSGRHWSVRADEAQRVHSMVVAYLPKNYKMFRERVDILIAVYFKNRPYDADNIASKFYVDALKGRIIKDDTPQYVGSVATRSEVDKYRPRLEILVIA